MRVRNQKLTVILVPQGGARTYSFQVRAGLLYVAGGLFGILFLISLTFVLTFGRLVAQSRQTAGLQREVKNLRKELGQVDDLRAQIRATDELRQKMLKILGAQSTGQEPATLAGAGAAPGIVPAADAMSPSEEDFLRAVPRSWPLRGPVTRVYMPVSQDAQKFHPGIDIAATAGTPVRAAAGGTVAFAGWDPEYGYLVTLEHGLGLETRYGHNQRLGVATGDRVERGQIIAAVGSTGRSTAPHLHFEIRKDGSPVDPRQYLE